MAEKTDKDIRRLKTIVGKVNENTKIRLDQMINDFIMHPELKGMYDSICSRSNTNFDYIFES